MNFEELLIEEVKCNEILYNLKNARYKNIYVKDKIWAEIGKKLNRPADQCKTKWKGLRDSYRRSKKTLNKPSGSKGGEITSKWKWFYEMSFLDNFDGTRDTKGNISAPIEFDDSYILDSWGSDNSENIDPIPANLPTSELNILEDYNSSTSFISENSSAVSSKQTRQISNNNKKDKNTEFSSFLNEASEAIKKISSSPSNQSSTTKTFAALATTIDEAGLSLSQRIELDEKVHHVVYDFLKENLRM